MKHRIFPLILCLMFAFGCSEKNVQSNDSGSITDAAIIPVKSPQAYRYGPSAGTLLVAMDIKAGKQKQTLELFMNYSGILKEDGIAWSLTVPKWRENGQAYTPSVPLMDVNMDTSLRGEFQDIDVDFPIVREYGITDPEALAQFGKMAEQIAEMTIELPADSVKTGDILFYNSTAGFDDFLNGHKESVVYTLDGEFDYKGTRYVAASIDDSVTGYAKENGMKIIVEITGRVIFKKENMETVIGFADSIGKDEEGNRIFSVESVYQKATNETI